MYEKGVVKSSSRGRFGLVQYPITPNRAINERRVFSLIQKARLKKPSYLVFPEMWLGGPQNKGERKVWAYFYSEVLRKIRLWCAKNKTGVFLSQLERDGTRFYNTFYYIERDGKILGKYRKIHLFTKGDEHRIFSAGKAARPFDGPIGKIGGIICYDIRFPELTRHLAHRGIRLLIVPAQWPQERMAHWHQLLAARALENQIYVIGVNRTGKKGQILYIGESAVYNPWGEKLISLPKHQQIGFCDIDFKKMDRIRIEYPFFNERKL